MKILGSRVEDNHIFLTVESNSEKFKEIYNRHFLDLSKRLNIPGFRKGKASLDVVLNYVKSRGALDSETDNAVFKVVDYYSKEINEFNEDWKDKIFGKQVDHSVKELDFDTWKLVYEATFEKVPEVTLSDYQKIPTLVEEKSLEELFWPVKKEGKPEVGDVVVISMRVKNKEGELITKYSYDFLEVDLSGSRLDVRILDAIKESKNEVELDNCKLEIRLIECVQKRTIDEQLIKDIPFPEKTTPEEVKKLIRSQFEMQNVSSRHREVVKWILSADNKLDPMPVETLKTETYKGFQLLRKRGNNSISFEDLMVENIKNLKLSRVLDAISKRENLSIKEGDQESFFKELDEKPWLYGYKSSEALFALPKEELDMHVLQFKTFKFLESKLFFSNRLD
ncbi:Trigger factor [Mycoplasma haemocanis str. Illinois]|uniref:Trigger factor n=1 Tax=Mycoplasma haemocanis (strain Illinois) TaxID=1111676 RepID=H6N8H2_MYCHN|nr:trigger factor [Mycoplasma haemocanis]AEW45944.1 Trigger factor [Mycoplasma haemocanis str. Illinois]